MHATWVTGSGRSLATRIDSVVLPARGAVVLIPSAGREYVAAFRTMRALAVECAERGFISFSPDLSGMGDSEPTDMENLAQAWIRDVQSVVDMARRTVEGLPVHLVGLRLGATLVDAITARPGEVRIAWEPVSGRAFLRRAEAIRRLTISQETVAGGVEIAGAFFTTAQAASLSGLRSPVASSGAIIVREADRGVADRIASVSPHHARIPPGSIRDIVDLLPGAYELQLRPLQPVATALILSRLGVPVRESHVRIGPYRLPGVLTEPSTEQTSRNAVMFTAMGAELKSGPGGLWSIAARELAARGFVCLRLDRRLIGDALDTTVTTEPRPYTQGCIEDVQCGVRWLRDHTSLPVITVGVCSGAWSFLRAAHHIDIGAIVAVNNVDWDPDPASYDETFYEQAFRFDVSMNDASVEASAEQAPGAVSRAALLRRYRTVRHRLGVRFPGVRAHLRRERMSTPVSALIDPVRGDTRIHLIMGPKEISRFRFLRGEVDLGRARRLGRHIDVRVHDELDHSMLSEAARRVLLQDLFEIVQ